MTDDLTFTDLVDFLRDHDGKKVYVEIGTRDQESRERHTDEFIVKVHGHRLGVIQDATDPDSCGRSLGAEHRSHPED